jgi:hypothetical protein
MGHRNGVRRRVAFEMAFVIAAAVLAGCGRSKPVRPDAGGGASGGSNAATGATGAGGADAAADLRIEAPPSATPVFGDAPIGWAAVPGMGLDTTTGGAGGPIVTVTTRDDLFSYLAMTDPVVIQVAGTIDLRPDTLNTVDDMQFS